LNSVIRFQGTLLEIYIIEPNNQKNNLHLFIDVRVAISSISTAISTALEVSSPRKERFGD